jgi:hypothetical protein
MRLPLSCSIGNRLAIVAAPLLALIKPVAAETVPLAVFGPGAVMTQAQCAAIPEAVWVGAFGRSFCIRYYLSTAGGEGKKPVVFLQGDFLENKEENTDDIVAFAARISRQMNTTAIYLARLGREGSSGSHDFRHSFLELDVTNAALDAIKKKYKFEGFNVYGHSGGAILVGGLLHLRNDLGCAIAADGRLEGTRKAKLPDPALRDFSVTDWVTGIAQDRSARIIVVTDPQDRPVPIHEQLPFVEKLRKAGGKAEIFFVDAGGDEHADHHFTTPYADLIMHDCLRGASYDEIAVDVAKFVADRLARLLSAAKAKETNPKDGSQP